MKTNIQKLTKKDKCPKCNGVGRVEQKHSTDPNLIGMVMINCEHCNSSLSKIKLKRRSKEMSKSWGRKSKRKGSGRKVRANANRQRKK